MTGILDGTDALIFGALRLDERRRLKQKTVCRNLSASPEGSDAIEALVTSLYDRIGANWSGRIPSQQNWRLRRQADIVARNKSPEVVLERALAVLGAKGVLDDWYNQIPVASGLNDHRADIEDIDARRIEIEDVLQEVHDRLAVARRVGRPLHPR